MKWFKLANVSFPGLGINLKIPDGFMIGSYEVRFYTLILAAGLLAACIYGLRRKKQFGLTEDQVLDGVLWIVPFAILCARAYYCIFEWDQYASNPVRVLYIWEGGIAIYGGVIGAAIGILVYCRVKKISVATALDITAISFLLGQAIGRWGNFFNKEAFGAYCGNFLAMRIPANFLDIPADASVEFMNSANQITSQAVIGGYEGFIQVHPTFLYESLWNIAGFVLLHYLSKRRKYDGQIALGYAAWYGLGRTFIEGLRMDSLYWGPFRVSQMLAAISCFAAVTVLVVMAFREHDPAKLYVNRVAAMAEATDEEEPIAEEVTEEEPAAEEITEEE